MMPKVEETPSFISINETEEMIRSQQEKILQLQEDLERSQVQLLAQKEALEKYKKSVMDEEVVEERALAVLHEGGQIGFWQVKNEKEGGQAIILSSGEGSRPNFAESQAKVQLQLQGQIKQLQVAQQKIIEQQSHVMNALNSIKRNSECNGASINACWPQLGGTQDVSAMSAILSQDHLRDAGSIIYRYVK